MTSKTLRGRAILQRWERTNQARLDAMTFGSLCKDVLDHVKNIALGAVLILSGRVVAGQPTYQDFSWIVYATGVAVITLNTAVLIAWFFRTFPLKFWASVKYSKQKKSRDVNKLIIVFSFLWVLYGFFVVKLVELLIITKLP